MLLLLLLFVVVAAAVAAANVVVSFVFFFVLVAVFTPQGDPGITIKIKGFLISDYCKRPCLHCTNDLVLGFGWFFLVWSHPPQKKSCEFVAVAVKIGKFYYLF